MKGGSVILTPLLQADGLAKNRPALVFTAVSLFGDLLVCGISTRLRLQVPDFDEVVDSHDPDFSTSGLFAPSLIRLGYVTTVPLAVVKGRIGAISSVRYPRLVARLADLFSNLASP